ncbi:hypothetical protein Bbelb_076620 [Branchiostoma belcheri]|nr:hypothetical protein Bbelb_076620 [Branchiostoma belcheri]
MAHYWSWQWAAAQHFNGGPERKCMIGCARLPANRASAISGHSRPLQISRQTQALKRVDFGGSVAIFLSSSSGGREEVGPEDPLLNGGAVAIALSVPARKTCAAIPPGSHRYYSPIVGGNSERPTYAGVQAGMRGGRL